MIRIERDPSGHLARLECDRCHARSSIFLRGLLIHAASADPVRRWLRMHCGGAGGWSLLMSDADGVPVILDLCPECTRGPAKAP